MPKILRIRLYQCEKGHEFETAETIVGVVRGIRRHDKRLIYTHTVKKQAEESRAERDYMV